MLDVKKILHGLFPHITSKKLAALESRVEQNPTSLENWLGLIDFLKTEGLLNEKTANLVAVHDLRKSGYAINYFSDGITRRAAPELTSLAKAPRANIDLAVGCLIKWKTAVQCGHTHDVSKGYFTEAEKVMERQWNDVIWPLIKDLNFDRTLDLACGHGRNTDYIRHHAKKVHLIDINKSCIDACRERFGAELDGVRFEYHLTDGNNLAAITSDTMTLVYTWDSMVHFDKLIVRDYVAEIARILESGGHAFLHHSNLGAKNPDSDWATNTGTRSDMSAGLMRDYADENDLVVVSQHIHGRAQGWGEDGLDCVSILRKP